MAAGITRLPDERHAPYGLAADASVLVVGTRATVLASVDEAALARL